MTVFRKITAMIWFSCSQVPQRLPRARAKGWGNITHIPLQPPWKVDFKISRARHDCRCNAPGRFSQISEDLETLYLQSVWRHPERAGSVVGVMRGKVVHHPILRAGFRSCLSRGMSTPSLTPNFRLFRTEGRSRSMRFLNLLFIRS